MGNALEGSAGRVDVMIIGGGPTGIGAAYRLNQHSSKTWILLDAEKQPGGLAGSVRTHEGFRFDHGYKTFCSRYDYIDRLLQDCYGENSTKLTNKTRDCYVFVKGKMVRFPLQNNLSGLPVADQLSCALDLVRAKIMNARLNSTPRNASQNSNDTDREQNISDNNKNTSSHNETNCPPETLDSYLLRQWGESLCNIFFRPYLFKSFAYPTSKLSSDWAHCKILPCDLGMDIERIIQNEQCDPGLDSESTSIYPNKGGLVSLWKTIVRKLPKDNVRFKSEIIDIDIDGKTVKTKDGLEIQYENMITTMPLNSLLELAGRSDLAEPLTHSSLFIVCLGVRGHSPHKDITGCIYYPESDCVFHRACIFSSFDSDSVPEETERIATMRFARTDEKQTGSGNSGGPYWSLMLEVSAGPLKTISDATIMDEAIKDACCVGLLRGNDEIVSIHMTEMTHGQPMPSLESDEKASEALKWLQSKGIYSRGRFGAFKYHIGDLDNCFIQGVEAADNIAIGAPERCVWQLPADTHSRSGMKISEPVYEVTLPIEEQDAGVNAGEIRNAITREPSCSSLSRVSSGSPISRASSQNEGSSQTTDSE